MIKKKHIGKLFPRYIMTGALTMSMLFAYNGHALAKTQQGNIKDVKLQISKDAREFSENSKGQTKYNIYQKNVKWGSKIKDKFLQKLQTENKISSKEFYHSREYIPGVENVAG